MTHFDNQPSPPAAPNVQEVRRAVKGLDGRALGLSLGIVGALAIGALTELSIVVDKEQRAS